MTDGAVGECPDWYPILRASKYLGVAPWDLVEQPRLWTVWALMAEDVSVRAQKQQQDIDRQRQAAPMGR